MTGLRSSHGPGADPRQRYLRASLVAGTLSTATWLWLQLDLLDRRVFSNFYDIQARALLDGRLDVPGGSLGNEAFVVRGQEFLYNPPGPSLLRMPVFLVTDRFDGRLTVLSMLAAWVVTVVLLSLLVWRVRTLLAPGRDLTRWEAAGLGAFLYVATVGSTLLYLGAVPWVFHEAYAWAVPMTVGSAHALLGVLLRPRLAGVLATGAFTLGAALSRATAGLACGAAVAAAGAWFLHRERAAPTTRPPVPTAWWRVPLRRDAWWWKVALAGVVPVVVGAGINWAKFRHPFLFPIEDQVFTGLSTRRREAILANGGDLFDPGLIWSTVPAYFRPDGIRFSTLFPFIDLPAEPAQAHRGGFLDLTYRTGSVTTFMPLLAALSLLGAIRAFRPGAGKAAMLRLPLAGAALVPAGVLFGAYISHRYTAEFQSFLLVAGAVGAVEVGRRLAVRPVVHRNVALGALGAVALFGVLANVAVAVSTQALANPGPVLVDHLDRQERFSPLLGGDLDDHVVASVQIPEEAPPGEVRIVGACQAVFVATGEEFTPWVEAGTRPAALRFTRSASVPSAAEGELVLARFTGHRRSVLVLERVEDQYRVVVRGGGHDAEGSWIRPAPAVAFEVAIGTDRVDDYEITIEAASDGDLGRDEEDDEDEVIRVPKENHDERWLWMPNLLTVEPQTPQGLAAEGVLLEARELLPVPGCEARLDRYRERFGS